MEYETSFLGLLVTLLFVGITGIYPGGVIVPSYLALFVHSPGRIAGTLMVALLTLLCFKLASNYLILFGTRRFVFMVLTAGAWTLLWLRFFPSLLPGSLEFRVIGWVVPGLIANNLEKQGILITTASLVTVTVVVYFLGQILRLLWG
ncbi:MAG: poly-gamma-glutamate biosynthesis protein PgsC [Acidobacteriia bacterium]|nr:poly-gamma-glutamate biosynthesis protein PgsC [Terriglobia bacterium]